MILRFIPFFAIGILFYRLHRYPAEWRLNLTMQVVAQVKKYFGDKVYRAVIPRTVRLSEAPSFGMPINFYEPNGKGCDAYMELAREFLANNER